jgi:uncharacterized protein YndB with AHSA1/START domain
MTPDDPLIIEREIVIEAPIEVVWRTVSEPDLVRQWFSAAADFEARPGTTGTLTFPPADGGAPTIVDIAIVAADRPHRLSFRWIHPPGAEPADGNSLLVTFTLVVEAEERTRLRVVETGLAALPWADEDKDRYADEHRRGWERHTDQLRRVLTAQPRG